MDVIFDVDGTLLNIEHRVPLIRPKNGEKKDWTAFREAAVNDVPHTELMEVAIALYDAGHRLIICTGRMSKEYVTTYNSLLAAGLPMHMIEIYMRPNDDVRPDHAVKLEMLSQIRKDGYDPKLVFDDRQQVVNMWRAVGIRCCQVAPGNF